MDWISIAGAAIFGGIGGSIGAFVGKKIAPSEEINAKTIRLMITVCAVISTSLLWTTLVKPMVFKGNERSDFENILMEADGGQVFSAMKKYDVVTYNTLIDELMKVTKSKNSTNEEITASSLKIGQASTLKYYNNAMVDDIYQYVKKYTEYLTKKNATQPLIICKLENPQVYGVSDEVMRKEMKEFGLYSGIETIVKNSMEHPNAYDKVAAETAFNSYITEYSITYPVHMQTLSMTTELSKPENVKKFADAYLDAYRELIKLSPEKCAIIYKYMKNMR